MRLIGNHWPSFCTTVKKGHESGNSQPSCDCGDRTRRSVISISKSICRKLSIRAADPKKERRRSQQEGKEVDLPFTIQGDLLYIYVCIQVGYCMLYEITRIRLIRLRRQSVVVDEAVRIGRMKLPLPTLWLWQVPGPCAPIPPLVLINSCGDHWFVN